MELPVLLQGGEIRFVTSTDLPAGFRRAIAADNTLDNPIQGRKKQPPAVHAYHHNPYTKEVILPRSYWPQMLARADEYGVQLQVTEQNEDLPAAVYRRVAVSLADLAFGLDTLRVLCSGAIPADWADINIQVRITQHKRMPADPAAKSEPLVPKPFPWEGDGHGGV